MVSVEGNESEREGEERLRDVCRQIESLNPQYLLILKINSE